MTKGDKPTLQMIVQRGHLVPAGPYEAEVIDSYQQGAVLTVEMHQKRSLPLLKKYWAVLSDLLKNAKTPWESKEEASDALKLALGVTDTGKTLQGQWFIRPGSISFDSMDQSAFREFFDQAMAVLAQVTGLDPLALADRYRHIPDDEPASPVDAVGSDGTTSSPGITPVAAAESEQAEEEQAASDPRMEECLGKFLALATDHAVPDAKARQENIIFAKNVWKEELRDRQGFVKACTDAADKIVKGQLTKDAARAELERWLP